MNENKPKLDLVAAVEDVEKELTPKEKKMIARKKEKEEKERKDFINGMVRRGEVMQLIDSFSKQAAESMGELLREPIRTNLISTMALSDLLKEKGIITEEEHLASMNKIVEQMNQTLQSDEEDDSNGEEAISFPNQGNSEEEYAEQESRIESEEEGNEKEPSPVHKRNHKEHKHH